VEERPPHRAMELLQTATTISAIAIALATLTHEEGPELIGVFAIPTLFLLSGLASVIGSLYAMAQLWEEAGMAWQDIVGAGPSAENRIDGNPYVALVVTTWGLWLLSGAYIALLLHNAP
jgi:hypothetical protein